MQETLKPSDAEPSFRPERSEVEESRPRQRLSQHTGNTGFLVAKSSDLAERSAVERPVVSLSRAWTGLSLTSLYKKEDRT
jgi:hypothetical protein